MVKHNNVINNNHFRKDWQRFVKTFFDQPAKKKKEKAAKMAPRPVGLLRPSVKCPSIRYNMKVRAGRGFTVQELKAAGISPKTARTIGISVDTRRKNRCQEGLDRNVKRLQDYKASLVLLTRKQITELKKSGTSYTVENTARKMAAVTQPAAELEVMKLSDVPEIDAFATIRNARAVVRQRGWHDKKKKEEEEKKK